MICLVPVLQRLVSQWICLYNYHCIIIIKMYCQSYSSGWCHLPFEWLRLLTTLEQKKNELNFLVYRSTLFIEAKNWGLTYFWCTTWVPSRKNLYLSSDTIKCGYKCNLGKGNLDAMLVSSFPNYVRGGPMPLAGAPHGLEEVAWLQFFAKCYRNSLLFACQFVLWFFPSLPPSWYVLVGAS